MKTEDALEIVSQTSTGKVRSHNEYSIASDAACGLVVLADGMGGYSAGEVASSMAVSVVATEVCRSMQRVAPIDQDEETGEELGLVLLRDNIKKANTSIYQAAQSQPQYTGMGTTIVAGLFYDNRVAVAHAGDSRMYRLRGGALEPITRDHSVLQEQLDSGMISPEEARHSTNKNLVTRAVGVAVRMEPEIHVHRVQVGDLYLLCSDGLNDMLEDKVIQSTLNAMQSDLPLAAERLVQMANDKGGRDNISVVLVKVRDEFSMPHGWLTKLLNWLKE